MQDKVLRNSGLSVPLATHVCNTLKNLCSFRGPSLLINLIRDPWRIVVQQTSLLTKIRGLTSSHTEVPNGAWSHPPVIRYYNLLHSYITACTRIPAYVIWPFWCTACTYGRIFRFVLCLASQDTWEPVSKILHRSMTKNAPSPTCGAWTYETSNVTPCQF